MNKKYLQIVLVGHMPQKLIFSIDKEIIHKIIFITEKKPLSGTPEAKRILKELIKYYVDRKIPVQSVELDFHIQTKPIAELTHLIYQQRIHGFDNLVLNISGGLRYMVIWLYIACSITKTRIIHGDFIYEGNREVGITSNMILPSIPFQLITERQFEFLKLFFKSIDNDRDFFKPDFSFNENPLLNNRIRYNSLEKMRILMESKRDGSLSRGSINGYIQKLNRISALDISPNPKDKKEKSIEISYIGIAHFLHKLFINH